MCWISKLIVFDFDTNSLSAIRSILTHFLSFQTKSNETWWETTKTDWPFCCLVWEFCKCVLFDCFVNCYCNFVSLFYIFLCLYVCTHVIHTRIQHAPNNYTHVHMFILIIFIKKLIFFRFFLLFFCSNRSIFLIANHKTQ